MIAVIGLGFVGLTTALGFSQKENKVYGYDINQKQMGIIKSGKIPFFLRRDYKKHLKIIYIKILYLLIRLKVR